MATRSKPFDVNGLMKTAPAPAANLPGFGLSTAMSLPIVADALSPALQDLARGYIMARTRAGTAILDAADAIAAAREQASHGEWRIFLEAIDLGHDQAERLIQINTKALTDPAFADATRRGFLNMATAALLASPSTPPAIVDAVLAQPAPPTRQAIRQAVKEAKAAPARLLNGTPPTPADVAAMRDRVEALGATFDGTPNARGQYAVIFADHKLLGTIAELRPNISAREQAADVTVTPIPIADVVTPIPIADEVTAPIDDSRAAQYRDRLRYAYQDDDEQAEGIAALALGCHLLGLRCELLSEVLDDETYGILAQVMQ